jgi:hypothetical protein
MRGRGRGGGGGGEEEEGALCDVAPTVLDLVVSLVSPYIQRMCGVGR